MTPAECLEYNDVHIRQKSAELSIATNEVATAIDNVAQLPNQFGLTDNIADDNREFDLDGNSLFFYGGTVAVITNDIGQQGVSILPPVNPGHEQKIVLDQPNNQIIITSWNDDAGGGIKRDVDGRQILFSNDLAEHTAAVVLQTNGEDRVVIDTSASALVEMKSTTQGWLKPRMTTTQRLAIASPAEGLEVYDLTLHKDYTWDGTTWQAHW